MDILFLVRVLMVMPMHGSPPEGAPLNCRAGAYGEEELRHTRGAKRAMREVTVIECCDRKDAREVEDDGSNHRCKAPPGEKDAETSDVQHNERDAPGKIDSVGFGSYRAGAFGKVVGINPAKGGSKSGNNGTVD